MFDIITFGSATKDIFLRASENKIIEDRDFVTGKGVCFPLGSKVRAEKLYFTSGGGGTNSAATFAKQGFNVAYCGKIGNDNSGKNILKDLDYYGIDSRFVSFTDEKLTNHSVIIDVPGEDRTIFVYRGASDTHNREDIHFKDLRASWFYLAPFSKFSSSFFYDLIDFAKENNIKVMANPGRAQLKEEKIKRALANVDVVLLNMEEASILTGVSYEKEEAVVEKTIDLSKDIVLITQGVNGVIGYGQGIYYRGKPSLPDADDRTGAGDSFGAGFLSEYMRSGSVKKGIDFGIANSTSCLQKKGAKHGLLEKDAKYVTNPIIMGPDMGGLKW